MSDLVSEERWQAGAQFKIGSTALLFIDEVKQYSLDSYQTSWLGAAKKPCAIVIKNKNHTQVVGIEIDSVTIDDLRRRVADFDAALASMGE